MNVRTAWRLLVVLFGAGLLVTACGEAPARPDTAAPWHTEQIAGELAIARAGCTRCHAEPPGASRFAPVAGPALAAAARWHGDDGGAAFLRGHHGGEAAADLAAYVQQLGAAQAPLASSAVTTAALERGERLWRELACATCHVLERLQGLAGRTDHQHVAGFLRQPAAHRPAVLHDFGLDAAEAGALAAFLLRQQAKAGVPVPGFAYECFESKITSAGQPDLTGLQPAARGVVDTIDVAAVTRKDHVALRFTATLTVPQSGEWTFTTGSDDSSWLWIDGRLLVRNEALAPHRRRSGSMQLDAGPHALEVLYTEAEGGQSLEVLWRSPSGHEEVIPASAARADSFALQPPAALPAADAAAVQRGRRAARERRCDACHAIDDADYHALPVPPQSRPLAALAKRSAAGDCPQQRGAAGLLGAVDLAAGPASTPAQQLTLALERDGCLRCHARDGRGGLPPAVQQGLTEVEDLGDEGRLPPDLRGVGHRLRPQWLERVLRGTARARPYLRVRMPALPPELASAYVAWFAAVDGKPGDDEEPPFAADAIARGAELAGTSGKNCITCHGFAGHRALGPQGMDLALQHERLRPAYFTEWLLQPTAHRPNTRMPTLWLPGDATAAADAAALRVWSSAGAAAPVPPGFAPKGGLLLNPADEPRWHGAFLRGLSARCLAIGTPQRTHYAFDLAHGQLAWLWRGDFLDASGTWSGRAGQLLSPAGTDHVVLPALRFAAGQPLAVLGWQRLANGHPQFRLGAADVELLDRCAPQWSAAGSELHRRLELRRGQLVVEIPPSPPPLRILRGGEDATGRHELRVGEPLELVYQW